MSVDVTAGGATGGQASMTHGETADLAALPRKLDGFMDEMRTQFATLGDKILPTLDLVRDELGKLQKTVDRVNRENRELRADMNTLKAQVRELQLDRAAASTTKATRRAAPTKGKRT